VGEIWVSAFARLAQPDVIRVRVEHDEPEVGATQDLLEQDARRVGLARARLSAEERVPGEPARVEAGAHLGCVHECADVEPVRVDRSAAQAATLSGGAGAIRRLPKPPVSPCSTVAEP
jgi:hypothetical protein